MLCCVDFAVTVNVLSVRWVMYGIFMCVQASLCRTAELAGISSPVSSVRRSKAYTDGTGETAVIESQVSLIHFFHDTRHCVI